MKTLKEELHLIIKGIEADVNRDQLLLSIMNTITQHEEIKRNQQQTLLIDMLKDCTFGTRLDEFVKTLTDVKIAL